MSSFRRVFSSSVGTKLLIGLTGLALFAYLILHLAGNLLIFAGPETFNEYSHALISNPLVVPIEIGLLLIFLLHVYKTVDDVDRATRRRGRSRYAEEGVGRPHEPQERRLDHDDLVRADRSCCSSSCT